MFGANSTCLCSELVRLTYQDNLGKTHETTGNLEEISKDQATLLFDGFTQRGRRVWFVAQGHTLSGVVDSCSWEPLLGCFATVRLDESCRWSQAQFQPEHLLCLPQPRHRPTRATAA